MASRICLCLVLLLLVFVRTGHAATFESEEFWGPRVHITMWGQINEGDDQKFKAEVLKQIRAGRLVSTVNLYSNGGSVDAGLKIGEMVRTLWAVTHAPDRSNNGSLVCQVGPFDQPRLGTGSPCMCASACFFIWAAGYDREGDDLEIHDPRFENNTNGLSVEQYRKEYEATESAVRAFLTKVDIPDWTITKMFDQISSGIYPLKPNELELLRNRRAWLAELILSRCNELPPGNVQTNPARRAYANCAGTIYDAIYSKSAQKFLDVYGNHGETLPASPNPLPQVTTPPNTSTPPVVYNPPSVTPSIPPIVVPGVPTPVIPNDKYVLRENRDLDGVDIQKDPNVTQSDCSQRCDKNGDCEGFSFDSWNNYCILKSKLRSSRLDPRSVSGVKVAVASARFGNDQSGSPNFPPDVQDPAKVEYGPSYPRYMSTYFPGDGYASYNASNLDQCAKDICLPSIHCVTFTYFKNTNVCRIFNSTGQYFHGNVSTDSGVKTQEPD